MSDPQVGLHLGQIINPRPDGSLEFLPEGALCIDAQGRILEVGARSPLQAAHPGAAIQDHGQALILPGFVDAHVHLAQVFARARMSGQLLEWLDRAIYPAELAFADVSHAELAARAFVAESIRCGVTTAAIFLTSHPDGARRCFEILADSGLRAVTGLVHMERGAPRELCLDASASLRAAEDLAARWHGHDGGRIRYAFSPRYALSCSASYLGEIGVLLQSGSGVYLHTHYAESREECAAVKRAFPEAEDYLAVYEEAGLLGPRSLLAHAVHVSEREVDTLAVLGAAVVHCPSANLFLKSGVFPWQRHRDARVPFGLGSDVGAGPEMSPLRVMRDAALVQPDLFLDPRELLWRATLGGAQALHLDEHIGSFDAGKEADFVVLDPSRRPEIAALPAGDLPSLLGPLIFLGDDRCVTRVFVRGQPLSQ